MKNFQHFLIAILLVAVLAACSPARTSAVNTEYVLTTDMRDGKFVFLGVNEEINGVVNPALSAEPGERITVILVNGGYGLHDIVFPELNVTSVPISEKGETTSVTFIVPNNDTVLSYHDTEFQNLGMSGVLLVGDVVAPRAEDQNTDHLLSVPAEQPAGGVVEYTLESAFTGGMMVFVGKGGKIDGITNPDLTANPGDTVRIILISGEGAAHNIVFEDFNARSEDVVGQGSRVVLELSLIHISEPTRPY